MSNLYDNPDYFTKTHNINPGNMDLNAVKKAPIIKLIQNFCVKKDGIDYVEIGPGDGSLAKAAMNNGWNVRVFDTSNFIVTELGKSGIQAECIENFYNNFKSTIDVIALSHVIEHIHNPNTLMEKISSVQNVNGILYLAFPDTGSLDRHYHGTKWTGWDIPYHVIHYNLKSISYLLRKYNYDIVYFDNTFFNIRKHIFAGIKNKDLFGDYRKVPLTSPDYKINDKPQQFEPANLHYSWFKRMVKRVLSERNLTLIARKR